MHEHVANMSLPGGSAEGRRPTCPYCFRYYLSPFQLQSHIESVHHPTHQTAGACLSVSDMCASLSTVSQMFSESLDSDWLLWCFVWMLTLFVCVPMMVDVWWNHFPPQAGVRSVSWRLLTNRRSSSTWSTPTGRERCPMSARWVPSFTIIPVWSVMVPNLWLCVLQVCDFRSSFYSDLWCHFEQFHANTKHFLCRYCLRVLHNSTCYQQHFSIHQVPHLHTPTQTHVPAELCVCP